MCNKCDSLLKMANIHNHTDVGSFDSILTADTFVQRIKDLGQEHVVQTDHGSMRGVVQLAQKARKAGLKFVPGIEVYCTLDDIPQKAPDGLGRRYYHMLLLAQNDKGYRNLCRLTHTSYKKDGHFYYKPRVSLAEIEENNEGLIATTGCLASPLNQVALLEAHGEAQFREKRDPKLREALHRIGLSCDDDMGEWPEDVEPPQLKKEEFGVYCYDNLLNRLLGIFGDRLYGELQDCGEEDQFLANDVLKHHCTQRGIPLIVTSDAHYAAPEDARIREMMLRIRHNQMTDGGDFYSGGRLHLKSAQELADIFGEEPVRNTLELVGRCEDIILEHPVSFPVPNVVTKPLRDICIDEVDKRKLPETYRQRVHEEMDVIEPLGFENYFLTLREVLGEARKRGILIGPGRGSAAGSLVAYLTDITQIDPIKYKLLFSRFLNKHRKSPPDIDIDLSSDRREDFLKMVQELYGHDHVGQIATYGLLKPKSIARDLGRIYDCTDLGDEVAKLIPPPLFGREPTVAEALAQEPKLLLKKYAHIIEPMQKLESLCRNLGMHAGGIVISPRPLYEEVPVECKEEKDGSLKNIIQLSMNEIENCGLIKYDFLGLRNLTVITKTCELLGRDPQKVFEEIPLDDAKTFEHIAETKDFGGIFQFEGSLGIGNLLKAIKPTSISHISDATALFRPGALGAGMDKLYLQNREAFLRGEWSPKTRYEEVLKDTYGTMVYQEQLMAIVVELAGFDEAGADSLRRAVGKKKPEEMKKLKGAFIEGAQKIGGVSKEDAEKIWGDIEKNADYSFNGSHSVNKLKCFVARGFLQ